MHRKFFIVLFLCLLALPLFSNESNETATESPNPGRFTLDIGYGYGPKLDLNAGIGFGFLIFHNNNWDIRNHIVYNVYKVFDDDGIGNYTHNIFDKINFGWVNNANTLRPYVYIEGGIGFYSNESKKLFTTPLTYAAGLGLGLEIFPLKDLSFFFEPGIMIQFKDGTNLSVQKATLGIHYYIK